MENRRIPFENIKNARDLGGLKNKEGKTIRKGMLLRSANLAETSETDLAKLERDYHLAMVIDLRTAAERMQSPDVVPEDTEYVINPIFDESVVGVSHEKKESEKEENTPIPAMEDLYRRIILNETCVERFANAVKRVMEHDFASGSVLWHCTEGKDRCGLLAAFLLSALGVEREVVLEDYLITNETNVPKAEMLGKQLQAAGKSEQEITALTSLLLAKESYLNAAWEVIEMQYGGMEGFLLEGLKISKETIARFGENVLG